MKHTILTLTALSLLSTTAMASNHSHHHGHKHHNHNHAEHFDSPLGVMGSHTHEQGEWMLSYRYGRMEMEQNRDGTDDISDAEVLANFMVAPTDMDMQMHMFGAMYGLTDDVTLIAMIPYTLKSMNHVTRMGGRFNTETEGWGDLKIGALTPLWEDANQSLHVNATISLPTGSIDERGLTPMGVVRLPYPMQLGSGTFDLMPSITYLHQLNDWSFGSQLRGTLRIGENSNDYSLGNEVGLTGWASYRFNDYVSSSLRLDGSHWGDVDGAAPQLNQAVVPTARPDLRGGSRVDALIGVSLTAPELEGHRFAIEVGAPVYENLDGPQLNTDWRLTAGWQAGF